MILLELNQLPLTILDALFQASQPHQLLMFTLQANFNSLFANTLQQQQQYKLIFTKVENLLIHKLQVCLYLQIHAH